MLRWTARMILGAILAGSLAAGTLFGQAGGGGGRGAGPFQGATAPTRDATDQSTTGTSAMTGTVTLEGTGTPVRRARVTLTGLESRGTGTTLTDDQGRFSFSGLPAGRYTLTAFKAGMINMPYGAKRPGRPGTPIQLAEGEHLQRLNIAMPRGSVLTGIVVDENGEPATGVPVRALRSTMQSGERTWQMAGQGMTDDRGIYRIFQLQPGDYIVNAVPANATSVVVSMLGAPPPPPPPPPAASGASVSMIVSGTGTTAAGEVQARIFEVQQMVSAMGQPVASAFGQPPSTAHAPVYYPGSTSAASALVMTLRAGEERAGVDFQLQLVPTTRLGGIVTSQAGALPPTTQVALATRQGGATPTNIPTNMSMSRVDPQGRFTFNGVTPGEYVLQARGVAEPGGALWASTDVAVTGQPLPDIVLTLQAGMTVSGRVEAEGAASSAFDPSNVRVLLMNRGAQTFQIGGTQPAQVDSSGRFTINGVLPGRYTLSAIASNPGGRAGGPMTAPGPTSAPPFVLKSAMLNGVDLLDFPVEIGPNQSISNVVVTYTNRVQELSGTIQDTSGRATSDFTIIVFPSDARYWMPQARRISATRPGTDGRFTFSGLPAGEYRLTAVVDVEPGEWYDPEFLKQLASASIAISLSEGERKVQNIRLAGE